MYTETMLVGEPIYLENEYSFYYEPWNPVDFSIMIDSASLDMSLSSMEIKQFTGLSPSVNWVKKPLTPPSAQQGILSISSAESFLPGTGTEFVVNWPTFYDEDTEWICVGDDDYTNSILVEFATNTIACIKEENLAAVWIKPRHV